MRRTIGINLLLFCLMLGVVETLGQGYYRWAFGSFLWTHEARYLEEARTSASVFERHPYLVARPRAGARVGHGGSTITITALHTRTTAAAPSRAGAIPVAVVGGSTTFGTRLTDADTWPWLLQEKLGEGYAVLNYGVPGYSTAENIIQMALVVPEARPRIVVFYEGWNDIRNYHWPGFEADYYAHGMTQFDTLIPPVADRTSLLTRAGRYSALMRILDQAFGVPLAAADRPPSGEPDPDVDRVYVRNLQTLKAVAARFGMTALFVPQILNDEGLLRAGDTRGWAPYVRNASMPALMRNFNGLMAGVCAPGELQCAFVGQPLAQSWNNDDFVDEGHLSRRGGDKLATILAARIKLVELPTAGDDQHQR